MNFDFKKFISIYETKEKLSQIKSSYFRIFLNNDENEKSILDEQLYYFFIYLKTSKNMKNISFISSGTHGIVFKYKEKEEDNIYKTVKFTDDIKEVNIAKEIKEGKLKNCDYLLPINSIKQLEYMNIYEIHSIFMNLGTLKEYKLNTNL